MPNPEQGPGASRGRGSPAPFSRPASAASAATPSGPLAPVTQERRVPGRRAQRSMKTRLMAGVAEAGLAAAVSVDGVPTHRFARLLGRIVRPPAEPDLFASDEADMLDRAIHVARVAARSWAPARIPPA